MAQELESGVETSHPGVARVNRVGKLMDSAIRVPGTDIRIGLDPILGIVPVVGDAVSTGLSIYIIIEAIRAEVPHSTLVRMLSYLAVDSVVGSVPILGTVFDVFWRANKWNARLLMDHVEGQVE